MTNDGRLQLKAPACEKEIGFLAAPLKEMEAHNLELRLNGFYNEVVQRALHGAPLYKN
jgi:hypothetical protein